MKETPQPVNPLERFLDLLRRSDWGISVGVGGYLTLIIIGMLFSFCYYAHFNINVFRFSELSDFVLIPFADPFYLIFTFLSLAFVVAMSQLDLWWRRRYPVSYEKWTKRSWLGTVDDIHSAAYHRKTEHIYATSIVLYVLFAAFFYGIYKSKQVKDGHTFLEYQVNFEGELPAKDSLLFVGENSAYYFLYNRSAKESFALPRDKVNYVKIGRNKAGRLF